MELIKELAQIQKNLKAPKGQYNNFAKFKYRSCEDILEAVKSLLGDLVLTISDRIEKIGDRYYIRAKAKISNGKEEICTIAYAREQEIKKGMDDAQITGSASSYARKYALNGLLLIDDTKDADTQDNAKITPKTNAKQLLWVKVKKHTGNEEINDEKLLKVINDKSGILLKTKSEITEEKARNIINNWMD